MPARFVPTYFERTKVASRIVTNVAADDPPVLAVTLTVPARSGVSSPVAPTVATVGSEDRQVNVTPAIGLPFLSVTCAASWSAVPTTASVAAGIDTVSTRPTCALLAAARNTVGSEESVLLPPPHAASITATMHLIR